MLEDLLYQFQHHEVDGHVVDIDTMVLGSYSLKSGMYIRLKNDGSMDQLYVDKKGVCDNEKFLPWFQKMDFASCLIEMNKPVDPKKRIHSNNIFTVFCKYETFFLADKISPAIFSDIERYYHEFNTFKDDKAKEILLSAGYFVLEESTISACKERMLDSLTDVAALLLKRSIKENCYIKIFLDESEEAYYSEGARYLLPKIFNCNTYNIEYFGKVLGLSNTNMGMNSKKPYLEHKTTAFKVPFRIPGEKAITMYKLILWLGSQKWEDKPVNNGYIPVNNHLPGLIVGFDKLNQRESVNYLHFVKGINVEIDDYDFVPRFSNKLNIPVQFRNYLNVKGFDEGKKALLSEVEDMVNRYFFHYKLTYNYYTTSVQVSKGLSSAIAEQIMLTRDIWHTWFRKGSSGLLTGNTVDKVTMQLVLAQLGDPGALNSLAYALNVRYALLEYFDKEGNHMGNEVENAYEALKEKVINQKKNAFCESRMEFYLAAGQLLKYLFSLSKAQKMCYDILLRSVTSAKTFAGLKVQIQQFFNKYAYSIESTNPRYNKMLTIVDSYIPAQENEEIWLDMLLCGFASESIIYFKNKED